MSLTRFLMAWRTTVLPDREVVDALVHPSYTHSSPELTQALADWPGVHYWSREVDGTHLILTRHLGRPRRERWVLHGLLFLATLLTTTFAGAVLAGAIPLENILDALSGATRVPSLAAEWARGLPFSVPLLVILLCHEMGHYITARRYELDVSPPYFIPVPLFPWTPVGTLGAFIRLRTLMSDRRQLLDVGAMGPLAGFLVAVPVLWLGLLGSHPLPGHGPLAGMLVSIGGMDWALGDSLVTLVLRHLVHPGAQAVLMSPLAFAGWFGLFVTMLNLLPMAQLDGGHILYAALPRWHRRIAVAILILILALGWLWSGWLLWGTLVLLLSRGRLGHPPVLDSYRPLPRSRTLLALGSLLLFVITFAPVPFRI
ncbi:MAG TPA: site-2 protease family protein [Gemmatimonadales bacterium]|nr:site-2 protease family protein [Gemmatimonadales bacterium]